ncbi:MAG: alanine--glyoxylate aminotransferase family protein [Acidobacteriota bacterium]|nr:MAG: alanine--glyoxylate aminotransferase family protein [Acidobacteriota bacterium]
MSVGEFKPPSRILMGAGPSNVPNRVLRAMAAPTIGHLDPEYLRIMSETSALLREVFRTRNELTLVVSGAGSAGMEACVCSLIEPGDEMIVCVNGKFGARMQDIAERNGAVVHAIEAEWGEIFDPEVVAKTLKKYPKTKVFGIVHAETSTGTHQPVEEISKLVHEAGALFLLDTVTSLGGVEVAVDDWKVDACFSGSQKCLSCPPGLAPVTLSPAAVAAMEARKTKARNWYLDISMVREYWGEERVYHHTAPINMTYALREALRIVLEEGLEARIKRHELNHRALRAGLEAMGLRYVTKHAVPVLNPVYVPDGADDARVRRRLLEEFGIEVSAGLGPFKGKVWRIGIMGHTSRRRSVMLFLAALKAILIDEGVKLADGEVLASASSVYATRP